MIMLFFSFLDISFDRSIITQIHFEILLATIIVAVIAYFLIKPFDLILAEAAFITAIGPTATGTPVVINLKKGRIEFVTFSVVLNNIVIAFILPFFIVFLLHSSADYNLVNRLLPVLETIFLPLIAAGLIKYFLPNLWKKLITWQNVSFYTLILNVYIAASEASHYIWQELNGDFKIVFPFALTSITLCVISFSLGWLLGGKEFRLEASQSLGQKNNAFITWIAITFFNPIVVLGPVIYVFAQYAYISWQLYKTKPDTK